MALKPGESNREGSDPIESKSIRELLATRPEVHMLLALTCSLCAAQPVAHAPPTYPGATEVRLVLADGAPVAPAAPVALDLRASAPAQQLDGSSPAREPLLPQRSGSGDGDHSDHSGHMTTMWIVMGGMMAVMMIGAGVYFMSHRSSAGSPVHTPSLTGPAAFSIPVASSAGG